jgi:nucleoside 2-deoxyribosyltransferase
MKMTGLTAGEITKKSEQAKQIFIKHGLIPVSPWDKEKDMYKDEDVIESKFADLQKMWFADKREIESCDALVDLDGNRFSRGTGMEVGFMRYGLMRPVVFVEPNLPQSVRLFESDHLAYSIERAAAIIDLQWGKWQDRALWRVVHVWKFTKVLRRIWREIRGWF